MSKRKRDTKVFIGQGRGLLESRLSSMRGSSDAPSGAASRELRTAILEWGSYIHPISGDDEPLDDIELFVLDTQSLSSRGLQLVKLNEGPCFISSGLSDSMEITRRPKECQ